MLTPFFVGSLIALLLVAFSFGRELYNNYQIDQEIARLEAQKSSLEAEHFSILSLKEQLGSEDYLEGEARLKFGLKREGEQVVVLPEQTAKPTEQKSAPVREERNFRLWIQYFFH